MQFVLDVFVDQVTYSLNDATRWLTDKENSQLLPKLSGPYKNVMFPRHSCLSIYE